MLSTFVIVALQDLRKVFSFLKTDCVYLDFFSRGRTMLAFSFFLTDNFFFFPPGGDSRYFYLLFLAVFFFHFFSGTVNAVDIRLVNIYIYLCMLTSKKLIY